jgi:hypothetical protein
MESSLANERHHHKAAGAAALAELALTKEQLRHEAAEIATTSAERSLANHTVASEEQPAIDGECGRHKTAAGLTLPMTPAELPAHIGVSIRHI